MGTTKQKPKARGGEERALGVGTAGLFYTPQSAGSLHTPETCTQEREVTEQASSTNGRSLERPTWVVTVVNQLLLLLRKNTTALHCGIRE